MVQPLKRRIHIAALALLLCAALVPVIAAYPANAADGDVVINELMYHPAEHDVAYPNFSYREDAEFLELANTTAAPVDISGWCFTEGIDLCFPGATSLPGNGFMVLAKDAAEYASVYGDTADFEWTDGSLSNGGEDLVLEDDLGAVVDIVDYDDEGLWPVTPDARGPSLELIDPSADNNDPANWAASSIAGGTAGAANSRGGSSVPPLVTDHAAATGMPAGVGISVSATITGATSSDLAYVVGFGVEQSMAMTDTGGGVFTATIPGQAAGSLVRYRVDATGPGGIRSGPRPDDTINYWGVTVADSVGSDLPIFRWHVDPVDYDTAYTNYDSDTPCDGDLCPAVISYDGQVWDNVGFRVAGLTSRNKAKKSFRFDFPKSHLFEVDFMPGALDEFAIDAGYPNYDMIREALSWQVQNDLGFPAINTQHVRVEQNGSFYGLYSLREEQDGTWRDDRGVEETAWYKFDEFGSKEGWGGTWEKKTREDESTEELADLLDCLLEGDESLLRACISDNVDIPHTIHELATISLVRSIDQREFNFFLSLDVEGDERWRIIPDDLDRTWGIDSTGDLTNPLADLGKPTRRCTGDDGPPANELCRAFVSIPEFEAMYYRHLRTLVDEVLVAGYAEGMISEMADEIAADWDLDEAEWNRNTLSLAQHEQNLLTYVGDYRTHLEGGGHNGKVPSAQSDNPAVAIDVVDYAPTNAALESVRLRNDEAVAVDLSGWQLTGAGMTLPDGTVLAAGGTAVAVVAGKAFREANPGTYQMGEYPSPLNDLGGEVRLLNRDGAEVDSFAWGDPVPPGLILNEWNGVGSNDFLKDDGSDSDFGRVEGNGGDWFEIVVVNDHLDVRGWSLELSDSENGPRAVSDTFEFADDPLLADLRSGVVITISEDRADDVVLDPLMGDFSMNLQANSDDEGGYFTADSQSNFDTNNDDWQLRIIDDTGQTVFGPAGEGAGGLSGISSEEVGELQEDPSDQITAASAYGDGSSSTYGEANGFDETVQDFSMLRDWGSLDAAAPETEITTPFEGELVAGPTVDFMGTATDDLSGVMRVALVVRNRDTRQYLQRDGTFADNYKLINAVVADPGSTDTTWTFSADLPAGRYKVNSRAFDGEGKEEEVRPRVLFDVVDVTEPETAFTAPVDGATLGGPVTFEGTATDDLSGIDRVRLVVTDLDRDLYLQPDGSMGTKRRLVNGVLGGPGSLDTTWSLLADLPAGYYRVNVRAFDVAGNEESTKPKIFITVT